MSCNYKEVKLIDQWCSNIVEVDLNQVKIVGSKQLSIKCQLIRKGINNISKFININLILIRQVGDRYNIKISYFKMIVNKMIDKRNRKQHQIIVLLIEINQNSKCKHLIGN